MAHVAGTLSVVCVYHQLILVTVLQEGTVCRYHPCKTAPIHDVLPRKRPPFKIHLSDAKGQPSVPLLLSALMRV